MKRKIKDQRILQHQLNPYRERKLGEYEHTFGGFSMGRMNYGKLRVRNAMRKYGTADVDDLGPLWSRQTATRDQIRSYIAAREARKAARKGRKAGIIVAKRIPQPQAFDGLDPKDPWAQLPGVDPDRAPWE